MAPGAGLGSVRRRPQTRQRTTWNSPGSPWRRSRPTSTGVSSGGQPSGQGRLSRSTSDGSIPMQPPLQEVAEGKRIENVVNTGTHCNPDDPGDQETRDLETHAESEADDSDPGRRPGVSLSIKTRSEDLSGRSADEVAEQGDHDPPEHMNVRRRDATVADEKSQNRLARQEDDEATTNREPPEPRQAAPVSPRKGAPVPGGGVGREHRHERRGPGFSEDLAAQTVELLAEGEEGEFAAKGHRRQEAIDQGIGPKIDCPEEQGSSPAPCLSHGG